jgi:hypothetical protein
VTRARIRWKIVTAILAVAFAAAGVCVATASADDSGISVSAPATVAPGGTATFTVTVTDVFPSPPYVRSLHYWWTADNEVVGSINHLNAGQTRTEKTRLTAPTSPGLWCPTLIFFDDFTPSDHQPVSGGVFVTEVTDACVNVG